MAAQCVRCHDAGGQGNQVGPELAGIGERVDKEYLLRSLITPNSEIAKGFSVTIVELTNGKSLVGRVEKQTNQSLSLVPPQGKTIEISSGEIKKITETKTSVMPPMGALLTKYQLRDLISYLETL